MSKCVFTRCANPPSRGAQVMGGDGTPVQVTVCAEHDLAIRRITDASVFNAHFAEPPVEEWARGLTA